MKKLVLGFLLFGCHPTPPAPAPLPDVYAGADGANLAAQACARLAALHCNDACDEGPCPTGDECVQILQDVQTSGLTGPLNLPCVIAARSQSDIEACGQFWKGTCGR